MTRDADLNYLKAELYELVRRDPAIFDFLQAGSLDGIWFWDLEHPENEWMSPRFWEVLGFDPAEKRHLACEWQGLIDPADLQVARENLRRHCADPAHPYDQLVRYRHRDGSTVWVRCRGIAIRDPSGRPIRMLGAHNDVTSLMVANLALRRADELKQAILGSLEDVVLVVERRGHKVMHCNERVEVMFARSRAETEGASLVPLFESEPDHDAFWGRADDALASGRPFHWSGALRRTDGDRIPVRVFARPLPEAGGVGPELLMVIRDVTEQAQADASKQSFVNTISHELRTPLASIIGYVELLEDGLAEPLGPIQQTFLRQIEQGAVRLRGLVDDLLDFARLQGGTLVIAKEPCDLGAIVRDVGESLRPLARAGGSELKVETPAGRVSVHADPRRIGQVVLNLVGNAIKFTPAGGTITIRLVGKEPGARLEVTDTGPGIAPRHLPHLFETFYQADPSSTRAKGGIGLGLAISKALVGAHGGTIGAESRPGEGATFWVEIP